jgi:hypothetical protein
MEMSQGNSLLAILNKILQDLRTGGQNRSRLGWGGLVRVGGRGGDRAWEGDYGANAVCTCM